MEQKICDGTWVTMITPFTKENKIDYPGVAEIIEWYIQKGIDGIFAVCQSSEMFYLSLAERVELARFVLERAAGRIPVVVSGHVSESLDDQIEELSAMAALDPQAVVLVSNRLARRHESDEIWKKNAQVIHRKRPIRYIEKEMFSSYLMCFLIYIMSDKRMSILPFDLHIRKKPSFTKVIIPLIK